MEDEKIKIGGGVILEPRIESDKIFGADNSIGGSVFLESADYTPYLTTYEVQKKFFDTYGCLTFSGLNLVEIKMWAQIQMGDIFLKEVLEKLGCLDDNGFPNFSDRFNVKASGTIPYRGNSQRNVFTSFRKDGLVGEKNYPFTESMGLNEYYQKIPREVIELGQMFLEYFDVQYEWTREKLSEALKYGPVQVIVDANYYWKADAIWPQRRYNYNHAMTLINQKEGQYRKCWDQYEKRIKKFHWEYKFASPARVECELKKSPKQAKELAKTYDGKFVMGEHPGIYKIENGKKRPFAKWFDFLVFSGTKENFHKVDPVLLNFVEEGKPMDVRESPYWQFVQSHYDMLKQMSAPDNIQRLEAILEDKSTGTSVWSPKPSEGKIEAPVDIWTKILNLIKKIFNS